MNNLSNEQRRKEEVRCIAATVWNEEQ